MNYEKIILNLQTMHPDAECELNHKTPFELLVAVILSAQCTDKRVNEITGKLFLKYNTPEQFAALEQGELEKLIFSAGFYRNKAKNIISAAKAITLRFGGKVPDNLPDLMSLDGVGRKTANVVYSVAFGGNAIAVDTHVFRVANRLGIADAPTPEKTEMQLMKLFPENEWGRVHHLLIFHGRYTCHSRKPDCERCLLKQNCKYYTERG